ncbi:MAG: nucleotidyltransferase family protein [Candidatus Magnetomorum sp.]|nr:nucleotidyltransferase family protein [Candidatus Magnetomorum sp.]
MTQQVIVDILKSIKQEARHLYKSELCGLFGSYSRGQQIETSDIDVLVKFLPGATLLDLSGLGDFLENKLHSKVDIVSERGLREEIKPYITNDLIVI